MEKYCSNCGTKLNENADICLNCGKLINQEIKNRKTPGKGLSISGMVLGIIAIIWTLLELLAIETLEEEIVLYEYTSEIISFAIGYTLFALIPSIVGLSLSGVGYKKQKNGFNVSGILLNAIALVINIIIFIYIIIP